MGEGLIRRLAEWPKLGASGFGLLLAAYVYFVDRHIHGEQTVPNWMYPAGFFAGFGLANDFLKVARSIEDPIIGNYLKYFVSPHTNLSGLLFSGR